MTHSSANSQRLGSEKNPDVESGQATESAPQLPVTVPPHVDEFEDNTNVPQLSALAIFWLFLTKFGIFAWGGPVAQIALIKDRLVVKERWITMARFNRVFAVYQLVPGPEATELCMFFGCLSGGRVGGILAGLGFILPGFLLMVLASYLYVVIGFGNRYVGASFRALQPIVAAMVSGRSTFLYLIPTVWTPDISGCTQDSRSCIHISPDQEDKPSSRCICIFHCPQ